MQTLAHGREEYAREEEAYVQDRFSTLFIVVPKELWTDQELSTMTTDYEREFGIMWSDNYEG